MLQSLDKQKPSSVGKPAGPSVRIAHEADDVLIDGTGEVVISGNNVTPGYENNIDANEKVFLKLMEIVGFVLVIKVLLMKMGSFI